MPQNSFLQDASPLSHFYIGPTNGKQQKGESTPIITIKMAVGRTPEQRQEFAKAVTLAAVQHLNVESPWVNVLFDEYPSGCRATDGTLHSVRFGPGCGKDGAKI